MASNLAFKTDEAHLAAQNSAQSADDFARELTELCQKYRIGIAGEPELFVMETDDLLFRYHCGDDGHLRLD